MSKKITMIVTIMEIINILFPDILLFIAIDSKFLFAYPALKYGYSMLFPYILYMLFAAITHHIKHFMSLLHLSHNPLYSFVY
jgi:hypothetical protein